MYRMRLDMAVVSGTRWAPDVIMEAAKRAVAILGQCDIEVSLVELHEFTGPLQYRYLLTPHSREFARRSGLGKPAVFFVDDTLQRPAFDAEAIGRANAKARPEMAERCGSPPGFAICRSLSRMNGRSSIRGNHMNLGGPSAARLANGLGAVFFRAPVPSGCTLTAVLSKATASILMRTI